MKLDNDVRPIIVVLEDMETRVNWLKANFSECNIQWTETVEDFFKVLRTSHVRPKLIILDHDLGTRSADAETVDEKGLAAGMSIWRPAEDQTWPIDVNGENGMMAVDKLDSWSDVPTLIWSINTVRAPEMDARLKDKGFDCAWVPFFSVNYPKLHRIISQLIV